MGASGSKPEHIKDGQESSFFADRPVQLGDSLLNHLSSGSNSDPSSSNGVSATRQSHLDAHISSKIQSEVARLRSQEAEVRSAIAAALAKEGVDSEASEGGSAHSVKLQKDLDELRERTKRQEKQTTQAWTEVDKSRWLLLACFRQSEGKPLDCKDAAEAFREAVAKVEKEFVASIHA